MAEINLLEKSHPPSKRELGLRTEANKVIAKRYDKEFFDGDRNNGYGGYYYDGRWRDVARRLEKIYGLNPNSSVLDVGCAKGFLLFDLQEWIKGVNSMGIDISSYALTKAMEGYEHYLINVDKYPPNLAKNLEKRARENILPKMILGSADNLPWVNDSFEAVISINTLHNLPEEKCKKAIKEMIRVCKNKKNMFIQVDGYKNKEEHERMNKWVLTAETMKSTEGWLELFKEVGYFGDYFWTTV